MEIVKSADMIVSWSFDVDCPYCGYEIDLSDQNDDGCFTNPIFNNRWDDVVGMEATCPECDKEFKISSVEC